MKDRYSHRKGLMSPIIPPPNEEILTSSNVQLPKGLWAELDKIVEHEQKKENVRAKSAGRKPVSFSRQRVMRHLLEWSVGQYWEEEEAHSQAKPTNR